jgi:chemotaxis protein histidine kinase CheA
MDLIQDNIRHLYQNFMYLDRMNQGDTVDADLTKTKEKASRTQRTKKEETQTKEPQIKGHQKIEEKVDDKKENPESSISEAIEEKAETQGTIAEPKDTSGEQSQKDTDDKETAEVHKKEESGEKPASDLEPEVQEKEEKPQPHQKEITKKEPEPVEEAKEEKKTESKESEGPSSSEKRKRKKTRGREKAATEEKANAEAKQEKAAKKETKSEPQQTRGLFDQETSSTIADKFQDSGNSINDWFSGGHKQGTLGDRLKKKPVKDIKVAIGINEKFLFINELFNGNMHDYNDAIKRLNRAENLENAAQIFDELANKYNWDKDAQSTLQLLDFVERRFMQ